MKKLSVLALFPLAFLLTGCDQAARDFAKSAKAMLDEYAARIDSQILTESQYYQRAAVLDAGQQHQNLLNSLTADRGEKGSDLAAEIQQSAQTAAAVRSYLREFAESEFSERRDAYVQQADSTRQFLANLQTLQAAKDRVEALDKLLDALANKPGLIDQAKAIQQTVSDTKTDFDKLICDDIAKKLMTATGSDKASLTKLQSDRKCQK